MIIDVDNLESNKMKILVTGGLGVVGKPLVKKLLADGNDVWSLDLFHSSGPNYFRCDVSEFRQIEKIFKTLDFDYVYHLAAEFGRRNGEDFYENMWKSNAIGTKNLLRLQEERKFKMIFFSSSEIYGDYSDVMLEDVPYKKPLRQLNDYAISKWVNEQQIMNSCDRFGTETVRLRLFNTYGPGEYYSTYRSVVCIFIYHALHKIPYTVFSKHHRSLTYIDDAVDAIAQIVKNFKPGEVYNISGDKTVCMKDLSDKILEIIGENDSFLDYKDVEVNNTLNKLTDNSKAKRDLNLRSTVPLEEGLKRTIDWQKRIYMKSV